MKTKKILRMVVDVLMSAVLLVQMSYSIAGELVHEILGITLFALFIAHHILAIPFTKGLFKNARTPLGAVKLALDVLLTPAMLCVMLSALPISQYVFAFLGLSGLSSLGRAMHLAGAYQLFVLIGLHIGMHMDMMLAKPLKKKAGKVIIITACAAVFAAGSYFFASEGLYRYMFFIDSFAFIDSSLSLPLFIGKYLLILGAFAVAGFGLSSIIKRQRRKKK